MIGNVGDDVEVLGLHVSPDLDSILYALAGFADEERGGGAADETWHALETVGGLGGEDWFALGDRDLGLHLVRTAALRGGEPLSAVTARLATALGVTHGCCRRPTTGCALARHAGGDVSVPGVVRRTRARDEADACASRARSRPRAAPGVLEAIEAPI